MWFKVDDGLAFHRKTLRAGNPAMGLWVRAGSEVAGQLTDGFVSVLLARQLGTPGQARSLVEAGLWHRDDDVGECAACVEQGMLEVVERAREPGYVFHEWWLRNPSRADVEQDREEARQRMARVRGRRRGPDGSPERSRERPPNVRGSFALPGPARPDPTPLLTLISRLAACDTRASAAPPPAEQVALWQELAGPGVDLEGEARAYLERNLGRPARDEAAAWVGWLRAGARHRTGHRPPSPPRQHCGTPDCVDGWLPDRDGAAVACPACKPHLTRRLRAVPDPRTEAS